MKASSLPPIPIPPRERWRQIRQRVLPLMVFGGALVVIAMVWRDHLGAPTMVGQAEAVTALVSSPKAGLLAGCTAVVFQPVRAGEPLGRVLVEDPRLLEASLAVIRSELDLLRASLEPIAAQQRNAVNYAQLRLDWMKHRADLAQARVNLQQAEAEHRRTEELFRSGIASVSALDAARATHHTLQEQVEGLEELVAEGELSFQHLQADNATDIARISDEPMQAAIAVQEARLRLTETELSPLVLRAPMDGVVMAVHHRSGEAVVAGQPIVTIAASGSSRIVGYLRAPFGQEPQPGDRVQVRSRNNRRVVGMAEVRGVGAQLEALPLPLQASFRFGGVEMALPVDVTLPAGMFLRPGELVDLLVLTTVDD